MTLRFVKRNLYCLSLLGVMVLASCESNTNDELLTDALTTEEVLNVVLADDIVADVDDVVEDDVVLGEISSKAILNSMDTEKSVGARGNHPDCMERTVIETNNGKIVTLDFGDGCTGKRGREYAGKIVITYTKLDDSFTKEVSFESFSINGNSVEGGKTISKVKENSNGNPERSHSVDITVTFSTGEMIVKKGEKIKEKIAGTETDDRGDDVYLITGNWESVSKDGNTKKATITTSLRREFACKYIVSGVVEITKGVNTYTLDFGDGSCDNKATLTDPSGEVKEISLRKRKR